MSLSASNVVYWTYTRLLQILKPTRVTFLSLLLMTGGCLTALYFLKTHNSEIDDILVRIDRQAVRYPQEPYNVIPNLISADLQKLSDLENYGFYDNEIMVCTQTSLNNLYQIINLSRIWDGKISVAVFSFGNEVSLALHYMVLMRKCSEDVRRKTSFHLVYPISSPPSSLTSIYDMDFNCNTLSLLRLKHVELNYELKTPYPVNLLRNVALMHSTSTYVFNLDVDFSPSKGMKAEMEIFLKHRTPSDKQKKIAYVTPAFESKIPFYKSLSKKDLLVAKRNGSVRQFTINKCWVCHYASNYPRWLSLPYPSIINASYYVKFRLPYEPFYIADREQLPMFLSIFKQYGYNRASQLCEAYYSGYDFAVMNNVFVIHDGFKQKKQYTEQKRTEHWQNFKLFQSKFKHHLKIKYPDSNRTCKTMVNF